MRMMVVLLMLLVAVVPLIPVPWATAPPQGTGAAGTTGYLFSDTSTIREDAATYIAVQRKLVEIGGRYWRDTLIRGVYGYDIDGDGSEELVIWGLRYICIVDGGRVSAWLTTSMLGHSSWYFDEPVIIMSGAGPLVVVSLSNVYDVQPRYYNPATPGTGISVTYSAIAFWMPLSGRVRVTRVFYNKVYLSRTTVYNKHSGSLYMAGADIYVYGVNQGIHRITIYLAELSIEGKMLWENRVYSEYRRVPRLNTFTSLATSYYLYTYPLYIGPANASLALFASGYTGYWRIEISVHRGVETATYVPLIMDNGVNMVILGSHRSIHVIGMSSIHDTPPLWKSYTRADAVIADEALIPMAYGYYSGYITPASLWDHILLRTERFVGYIYVRNLFSGEPRAAARIIAGRVFENGYTVQTIVSSVIHIGPGGARIYMALFCYRDPEEYQLYLAKYNPYTDTVEKHVALRESVLHPVYLDIVDDKLVLFTPGRIVFYSLHSLEPVEELAIGSPQSSSTYSYAQVPAGGLHVRDKYIYVAQLYDLDRDYPNMEFIHMIPYTAGSALAAIEIRRLHLAVEAAPRITPCGGTTIRYAASGKAPPDTLVRFTVKGLLYNYTVSTGWVNLSETPRGEAYLPVPARGNALLATDIQFSVARYNYVKTGFIYNPPDIYGGGQRPAIDHEFFSSSRRIYVPGIPVELEITRPQGKLPPAAYTEPLPIEITYREDCRKIIVPPPGPGVHIVIHGDRGVIYKALIKKRISVGKGVYAFIGRIDAWFMEPRHTYVFEAVYQGDELREPASINRTVYAAGILTRLTVMLPATLVAKDAAAIEVHVYGSTDNTTWRELTRLSASLRIRVTGPYLDETIEENTSTLPWSYTIRRMPRGTYRVEAWLRPQSPIYEEPPPASAALYVHPLRPLLVVDDEIRVGENTTVYLEEEAPGTGVRRNITAGYRLTVYGPGGLPRWSAVASQPSLTVPGRVFSEPGIYTVEAVLIDAGDGTKAATVGPELYYEETSVSARIDVAPYTSLIVIVKPMIDLGDGSTYTLTPVDIVVETVPRVPGARILVIVENTSYTVYGAGTVEHVFRTPGAKRITAVYRAGSYTAKAERTIYVRPRPVTIETGNPPYINHTALRVVDHEGKEAAGLLIIRYIYHGEEAASTVINYTGGAVAVDPGAAGIHPRPAEARVIHVAVAFIGNRSYGNATRGFDILLFPRRNAAPQPLSEPLVLPALLATFILAAAAWRRSFRRAAPGA